MQWICEEGYCDEATRDKDWIDYANLLYGGAEPIEEYERLKRVVGDFCRREDEGRAARGGVRADAADRPGGDARRRAAQRAVRGPRATSTRSPTTCCRPTARSARPARGCGRRRRAGPARSGAAPRRAHRRGAAAPRASARRRRRSPAASGGRPLDGVKVLDLTWAMAGPATTRVMADFGADVVRVETEPPPRRRPHVGPFVNDVPGNDCVGPAVQHDDRQAQHQPRPAPAAGPRGARRPGALGRRGASSRSRRAAGRPSTSTTSALAALRPGLVMMSSCLFGQTGPLRALRRLRHDGRLARRVLPPHRLARPPAVRAVRRLQRLPVAALRRSARCSPRSTTAAAPARASTSTSPRPRRACTSSPRPCSTSR